MMSSADGKRRRPNTLVTQVFTFRRLAKPKNDDPYSFIGDKRYSPPRSMGPVGNQICRVYLPDRTAAHSVVSYLSRWAEGWVGESMGIHFTSNCMGRAEADAVDFCTHGGDQRGHGDPDCVRIGAL